MTYPGGKGGSGVAQTLINLMPPHDVYVEAFLGSAVVLRAKLPARSYTIGIDVARGALDTAMQAIVNGRWDLASPGSTVTAGIVGSDDEGLKSTIVDYDVSAGEIVRSGDVCWRTPPKLTLLQVDAIKFLRMNSRLLDSTSFVYCDPPYVRSARRSSRDLYEHEMSDEQHVELLNVLKELRCMVLLSGYYSDLYATELKDWNCMTFHTTNRAGARTTEYVWFNYDKPIELHDYRYLGKNFRERERIKRKAFRWKERLTRMPELERQALLWALREQPVSE